MNHTAWMWLAEKETHVAIREVNISTENLRNGLLQRRPLLYKELWSFSIIFTTRCPSYSSVLKVFLNGNLTVPCIWLPHITKGIPFRILFDLLYEPINPKMGSLRFQSMVISSEGMDTLRWISVCFPSCFSVHQAFSEIESNLKVFLRCKFFPFRIDSILTNVFIALKRKMV